MAWYKPKDIAKKAKKYVGGVTDYAGDTWDSWLKDTITYSPLKEITGGYAMEEAAEIQEQALEEQKRQYEEQKAAALAEEKALTRKAEQEKADASASAYRKLEEERRRRAAMKGRSSTILTGSLGDTGLTVQRRTLLGG